MAHKDSAGTQLSMVASLAAMDRQLSDPRYSPEPEPGAGRSVVGSRWSVVASRDSVVGGR